MLKRWTVSKLIVGSAIGLLAASCSGKVAQCNALIEEINSAGSLAEQFEQEIETELAGEMERLSSPGDGTPDFAAMATDVQSAADKLDTKIRELVSTMVTNIGSVELTDETLAALQARHIELANALGEKGGEMTGALSSMSELLQSMDGLISDDGNFSPEQIEQLQSKAEELQTITGQIEVSGAAFDELSQEEDTIISEINGYCNPDAG